MPARFFIVCLLLVWAGCSKQPASSGSPAEPVSGASASKANLAEEAQIAAVLGQLTQAVRKYGAEQRSVPKTLEELVAKGYLSSIPAAPAGKGFAINKNLQVYLVNR